MMSTDVFYEMPENEELYEGQYDIKAGRWPENSNECVLVLTQGGAISDFMLYTLGLRDPLELDEMVSQFLNEEDITVPEDMGSYDYDDIIGINFKLVNSADYYAYDSQYQVWTDKSGDHDYVKGLVENGEDLTIVGVVQPSEDANASALSAGICYPASLTKHMSEYAGDTEIVKQQLADPSVNVFTGEAFGEENSENTFDMESLITVDEEKLQEAFGFDESAFSNLSDSFDFSSVFGNADDSVDLSGMVDLSGININLPETGTMDLGEMLGNLDISISSEGFAKMAESLMEGYQLYVKDHPEADYSGLLESFQNYLTSDSAKTIMKESVVNIIKESGAMTVSSSELSSLFEGLKEEFAASVAEQNFQNVDEFYNALVSFMGTNPTAVQKFNQLLEGKMGNITVTDDQMTALAQEIMKGYYDYAQAGNGPDPSKIGEYFLDYLQTEDAQNRLAEGLAGTVDMGNVESQLTQVVENYMRNAMSSYGNAVSQALSAQISSAMQQMMSQLANGMGTAMSQAMANVGSSLENAMNIDGDAFADAFQMNMTGDQLTELMMSMNSGDSASYENNLATLGYVDFDVPSGIDIYPKDFESKEQVVKILDDYNSKMEEEGKEEQVITYTDVVGTLMSSVTDIIDIISYVLIAFVAISLVVSSIMIGVITYISVLERKKEIGILRAIGASKGNISQVFNAETFIIGFCAGAMGIIISLLLLIPGNALIHYLAGTDAVNAVLPVRPAVILILLSVVLTLIGGLIPSRKAAKSDPVTALRTE